MLIGHFAKSRLLLTVFLMISALLLISVDHTSDQETAGKTRLVAATSQRASVLHARSLARHTLQRRTATFKYMCLSAQASGRKTLVLAGRWHTEEQRAHASDSQPTDALFRTPPPAKKAILNYLCSKTSVSI